MKRLFLVSLFLLLLVSCKSVEFVNEAKTDSSLYYKSALEREESVENRYNYVYYLYTEGEVNKCITECDYALTLYPGYTRFLKLKALAERTTGDRENYILILEEVLRYEPHDEELRDLYLETLLEDGKKEEAYAFSLETITYYPENKKAIAALAIESDFYSYLNSLNQETSDSQV